MIISRYYIVGHPLLLKFTLVVWLSFYDLLQSFTNLRSFTLDRLSSQIRDSRFYPSVITLPMFPESLEEFSVTGILHTSIHFLFAHCENITSFAYFYTCASPYGFLYSELHALRSMTNLVSLKIPHSSISDVDFNAICEKMVNIKTLNISACKYPRVALRNLVNYQSYGIYL